MLTRRKCPSAMQVWVCGAILVLYCTQSSCSLMQHWEANDIIGNDEIGSKLMQFKGEEPELDYFKLLGNEGNRIIVGARNKLYNISMVDLTQDTDWHLEWKPNSSDNKTCNQKIGEAYRDKCQNFITVLGRMEDGKYYVCGTNAFDPKCRTYKYKDPDYISSSKFEPVEEIGGVGKSPYDPEHNSTAIFTDNKLFSATVADIQARDPLIIESRQQRIRTEQHNSNMINNPHFVSSYEVDDKIFFFMREDAVENINCGKATFSRVARVCKKDKGGIYDEGVWTSFFKARLNCSVPGDIPFFFDELQGTSEFLFGSYKPLEQPDLREKMIYGVFNTPENSIQASAVCAFTFKSIQEVFLGRFKGQETMSHNWLGIPQEKTPKPHPASECVADSKSLTGDAVKFIRDHPLMDMAVPAAGGAPILITNDVNGGRFTAITVDWQQLAGSKFYDVLFVGTTDGRVLKAINSDKDGHIHSVVIEDIQVLEKDEPVTQLKLFRQGTDHEKLIVLSRKNIVSIPVHRCKRHKTCDECVALQDPYCSWHNNECRTGSTRGIQDVENGDVNKCGGERRPPKPDSVPVVEVNITATEKPVSEPVCTPCDCKCNQSDSSDERRNQTIAAGAGNNPGYELKPDKELVATPHEPCESRGQGENQVYTASMLAIACVVSIVVSALIGFVIGYRISMCRSHTRNTEALINIEQHFGSLRKNPNRHSIEASRNLYSDPVKPQKIQNLLVTNNISQKSPNLPNGSVETRAVTAVPLSPNASSKTYV